MVKQASSRREFLGATGAALAGAALFGLAGCAPKAPEAEQTTAQAQGSTSAAASTVEWDEEYDVVVVGAGLAGMASAATVATEGNGATCLLLEKGDSPMGGGNSQFSSGQIWCTQDYDNMLAYMKALRGENETVSDAICGAYVKGMTEHVDWLRALGAGSELNVTWEHDNFNVNAEYSELDAAKATEFANFTGDPNGKYKHVMQFMDATLNSFDTVTRKTGTPATELVADENGAIVGLYYEEGGKQRSVKANKGVIMCCGGYENNQEMIHNYVRAYGAHCPAGVENTGDGIVMCSKVGAQMWHLANIAGFWPHIIDLAGENCTGNFETVNPADGILVGINGRRFMSETNTKLQYGNTSFDPADLLTSNGNRHGDFQYGGMWMHCQLPSTYWAVYDADNIDSARERFPVEDMVGEGWAYKADTVEELASQMGVPADELTATVADWNAMVEAGRDSAFHRDPDTMRPVASAPFYATRMCPWYLNTDGGPRRNENGQIISLDGEPIVGLYGAGEFGSIWSDMYNGGGNLSECLTFGRISVRHCLQRA